MDFENLRHLRAATARMRAEYWKKVTASSVSAQQAESTQDLRVKGNVWVSKFNIPDDPDGNSQELLLRLIDAQNERSIRYDAPAASRLEAQRTGYRKDATKNTPEPEISERAKFGWLMEETTNSTTILYIYGGTFVLVLAFSNRGTGRIADMSIGSIRHQLIGR